MYFRKLSLIVLMALCTLCPVSAKNALVVIAHGSPMPGWNAPVLVLENQLRDELRRQGITRYDYVRVALMEFTTPTIADVIDDCEREGIDRIYALPLFIAPSSHSEQDIPNIIGHKYDAHVLADLREEGTRLVDTKIPIVLGPTLSADSLLSEVMTARITEMSKDKSVEGIVLLAHGDANYVGFWKRLLGRIGRDVEQNTGIPYLSGTFVGMGQQFKSDVMDVIEKAAAQKKRLLVQGVYLATGVDVMARMSGVTAETDKMTANEVVFGSLGILPASSEAVCRWIIEKAMECDKIK